MALAYSRCGCSRLSRGLAAQAHRQGAHATSRSRGPPMCRAMRCWRPPAPSSASIDIDIRNIFDRSDPRENSGLYRLADRLHLRTKPGAIQAQLLFKSGDRYRRAEAGRNRAQLAHAHLHLRRARRSGALRRRQGRRQGHHQGCLDLESRHLVRARRRRQLHELTTCRKPISWGGGKLWRFPTAATSTARAMQ